MNSNFEIAKRELHAKLGACLGSDPGRRRSPRGIACEITVPTGQAAVPCCGAGGRQQGHDRRQEEDPTTLLGSGGA